MGANETAREQIKAQMNPDEKLERIVGPNADRYPDKDFPDTDCYGVNYRKEFNGRFWFWKKRYWCDKETGNIIHAEDNFGNKGWNKI